MDSKQVIDKLSQLRGRIPLNPGMSRRGFVAGTAAAAGALAASSVALAEEAATSQAAAGADAAAGFSWTGNAGKTMGEVLGAGWLGEEPQIADADIAETLECDVCVCGVGQSGTAVTRRAAECGAKVIAIDKQAEDGFMVIGSDFGHINSSWQTDFVGIPSYDPQTFMNEFQIYSANRAQPTLVSLFARRSGEAFDWFIDDFTDEEKSGLVPLNWPIPDGYDYAKAPYFHSYVGTANFDSCSSNMSATVLHNQQKAKDAGAQILHEHTLVRLVHNEDNTEVTGVIAQKADGSYVQINAKAVALCCGDAGSNSGLYNSVCFENYALGGFNDLFSFSGYDGAGIVAGLRMGAMVECGTGGDLGSQSHVPLGPMGGTETIWLSKYGKRFCNEAYGGPLLSGCAVARMPGQLVYGIWGANWKEILLSGIAGHMCQKYWDDASLADIQSYMDAAEQAGADGSDASGKFLYCADTLEELCDYMGMEEGVKANALAAIEAWNKAIDEGCDEEFGRGVGTMKKIDQGPFYGLPMSKNGLGGSLCTTSGLLVTGDQQVQGKDFEPIKGLYACGNNEGGRFPMGYNGIMNGACVGMCQTLGYCLGEFLATGDLDEATTLGQGNAAIKEATTEDQGKGK